MEDPSGAGDDLRGFDAVIAIAEDTVNSQLEGLFQLGLIDRKIDLSTPAGTLSTALLPPRLHLVVDRTNAKVMVLVLRFGAGTLRIGADSWQLQGVELGFKSRVGKGPVAKARLLASAAVAPEVKKNLANVDEERFTIEYLYISLKETVTAKNLFRVHEFPDLEALRVLIDLLHRHYAGSTDLSPCGLSIHTVLRQGAEAPLDDAPSIPSLTPTALDLGITPRADRPGWGTYNFLIMTGGRPSPGPRDLDLRMIDRDDVQGRYYVAERRFLHDGLLRRIQGLCRTAEPFTWDAGESCWRMRCTMPVRREERTVDGKNVVIDLAAQPDWRVRALRGSSPIRLEIEVDTRLVATYTENGRATRRQGSLAQLAREHQLVPAAVRRAKAGRSRPSAPPCS